MKKVQLFYIKLVFYFLFFFFYIPSQIGWTTAAAIAVKAVGSTILKLVKVSLMQAILSLGSSLLSKFLHDLSVFPKLKTSRSLILILGSSVLLI